MGSYYGASATIYRLRRFIALGVVIAGVTAILTASSASQAQQTGKPQTERPLLMRNPTLSKTQIAFSYAGDLWIVPRNGGEAVRLTTGTGNETGPVFSPDGNWIAFTGEYDGNVDVYLVPSTGGVPRRLTYHPGADTVVGWTPDGKQVLFASGRNQGSLPFLRTWAWRFTSRCAKVMGAGINTSVSLVA